MKNEPKIWNEEQTESLLTTCTRFYYLNKQNRLVQVITTKSPLSLTLEEFCNNEDQTLKQVVNLFIY